MSILPRLRLYRTVHALTPWLLLRKVAALANSPHLPIDTWTRFLLPLLALSAWILFSSCVSPWFLSTGRSRSATGISTRRMDWVDCSYDGNMKKKPKKTWVLEETEEQANKHICEISNVSFFPFVSQFVCLCRVVVMNWQSAVLIA